MKGKTNGKLFTPRQLSEVTNVSTQSIYYFIREHGLEHIKIGKKILLTEEGWETFLKRHREGKEAEI